MTSRKILIAFGAALAVASLSFAHETKTETGLTIEHAWARPSIPGARVSAAYMEILNDGDQPDALVSASISGINRVEIHSMTMDGDVMRMERLPEPLAVPAQGYVVLQPGGLHLMLMGLSSQLVDGDSLAGTLVFEQAGEVEVEFKIEKLTKADREAMANMDHSNDSEHSGHGSDSAHSGH